MMIDWRSCHRRFLAYLGGVPGYDHDALREGAKEFVRRHFDVKEGNKALDADGDELSNCTLTDTTVVITGDDCAVYDCTLRDVSIEVAPWCRWTVIERVNFVGSEAQKRRA